MFCTKCGTRCGEDQRFCNNCGAPLGAAEAVEETVKDAVEEVAEAETPVIEESAVAAEAVAEDAAEAEAAAEEAAEAAEEKTAEIEDAVEEAAEEIPAAETPAFTAPFVETPAAEQPAYQPPVFEQPQYQPPVQQPQYQPAPQYAPPFMPPMPPKKSGVGKWLCRIIISCLPLLVTYLMMFISGTGLFGEIAKSASSAKTLCIILLAIIGVSIIVQIACLLAWALSKKKDPATRDWAFGFIIAAIAVIVVSVLFVLGFVLFTKDYKPDFINVMGEYFPPIAFIRNLFSML